MGVCQFMAFKPSYEQEYCPICGSKLDTKEFEGYGITSGYNSVCPACKGYGDIWACGVRELQIGDWISESFISDYGTLTEEEKQIEKYNMKTMRKKIRKEKWKRRFKK